MIGAEGLLKDAIDRLIETGRSGGINNQAVVEEASRFAAMIAVNSNGAQYPWAEAFQRNHRSFQDEAALGALWRDHPTKILSQLIANHSPAAADYAKNLADIASAACSIGEPSLASIGIASAAAAIQMQAVDQRLSPMFFSTPIIVDHPSPALEQALGSVAAGPIPPAAQINRVPPPEPTKTLEQLYAELDDLVGLETVKTEIRQQAQLLHNAQVRKAAGLKVPEVTRHLVFTGNPGTGKTVVARKVAEIYRVLKVCRVGQLVECDRSSLVAGYLGQTAPKTMEVLTSALGGILFIDEAYTLNEDAFGLEAIATLLKVMEDKRDDIVVIVAGYPEEMDLFIKSNPGLASRFYKTIMFPDYDDEQLVEIFQRMCSHDDYLANEGCLVCLRQRLAVTPRDKGFANGRFIRNLFQAAFTRQAVRLDSMSDPTPEQLKELSAQDFDVGEGSTLQPPVPEAQESPTPRVQVAT